MSNQDSAENKSLCKIRFGAYIARLDGSRQADGTHQVEVSRGSTILDAARKAGVFVDCLCGGDGVCGKCRVIVREGKVKGGGTEFLTHEEIREGFVLACETRIESDLLVEVPTVSLHEQQPETGRPRRRLYEISLRERQPSKLDPLVQKVHVNVAPPTLDNNAADLERLTSTLLNTVDTGTNLQTEYQMGLKAIRVLPEVIHKANGSITATIAHRGRVDEITQVEAGDTSARNLGIIVDLGTTTVVAHLVDLTVGQTLESALKYNSQAVYGADVIRRIIYCDNNPSGLVQLQEIAVADINSLIRELEQKLHLSARDINVVVVAGNTTMTHLLLGINPRWIRREPYSGAAYQPPPFRAAEIGLNINPRGLLYCMPAVSSFVGGDITAGVMATGMHESEDLRMLIDVGTNGEIAIGNRDWLVCASASAGPAFEGAGNKDGMRATHGAIDHIRGWNSYSTFSYSTIGDKAPTGLCGTAYVDLLAELLRMGIIDKTGKLSEANGCNRIRAGADGTMEFMIVPAGEKGAERDLVITQDDLANLVRTKAAIYSAAKILLCSLGLGFSDLSEVMVAGAFGNYLDLENAVFIGLLPDLPGEKLRFVGNSSLAGAKMAAFSRERYQDVQRVAGKMTYLELSTAPSFMDEFTSACFFPHTNIEEFPSVVSRLTSKAAWGK